MPMTIQQKHVKAQGLFPSTSFGRFRAMRRSGRIYYSEEMIPRIRNTVLSYVRTLPLAGDRLADLSNFIIFINPFGAPII